MIARSDTGKYLPVTHLKERGWRCTCGGDHFVFLGAYQTFNRDGSVRYPEDVQVSFLVEDYYPESYTFWSKLKACWNLLRERRHSWCEIIIDHISLREIVEGLEEMSPLIDFPKVEVVDHGDDQT